MVDCLHRDDNRWRRTKIGSERGERNCGKYKKQTHCALPRRETSKPSPFLFVHSSYKRTATRTSLFEQKDIGVQFSGALDPFKIKKVLKWRRAFCTILAAGDDTTTMNQFACLWFMHAMMVVIHAWWRTDCCLTEIMNDSVGTAWVSRGNLLLSLFLCTPPTAPKKWARFLLVQDVVDPYKLLELVHQNARSWELWGSVLLCQVSTPDSDFMPVVATPATPIKYVDLISCTSTCTVQQLYTKDVQ